MPLAHVTETGNISIPKKWREELGIEPNSKVIIQKTAHNIIIEPLKQEELKAAFRKIDEEVRKKKIVFTREEAIKDDLYN